MKIVTVEQMRRLEEQADEIGLPSEVLMENAGLAVAMKSNRGWVRSRAILFLSW